MFVTRFGVVITGGFAGCRRNIAELLEEIAIVDRAGGKRWARYRDFYDIAMINHADITDLAQILDLVCRKEVWKTISQKSILRKWEVAKQEKSKGADLIVYTKEISNEKTLKATKASDLLKSKG